MFSRRSRAIGLSCVLTDIVATIVAFLLAYSIRVLLVYQSWFYVRPIYPLRTYFPLLLACVLAFPGIGYVLGAYNRVEFRRPRDVATDVLRIVGLGTLAVAAELFIIQGEYVSRTLLFAFIVTEFVSLAVGRWLFYAGIRWFRTRPEHHRNFVIVGSTEAAFELASLLEEGERFGLRLLALVYTVESPPTLPSNLRYSYPVLPKERLVELLHNRVVDEVVFAPEAEQLSALDPLMQQCEAEGVHMRVQLSFLPTGFSHVFVEHMAHVPLLTFASTPQNEVALLAKRGIDIALSSLALIVLAPAFALIALLIKLTSEGPVFYRQTRCGLGSRRFTLLKFRSMVNNAHEMLQELEHHNEVDGPVFKMRNDPRCTNVGRWLRILSLDELPQLWNVLRGDMSLVGPRPPLPQEVEQYEPWQRRRLRIRPGLTCLWALEGRSKLQFDRWMRLDLLYIDNWSMWLDLKILLKTIPAVLLGKGAH
jgi:exopolysaccharide biosynthesis polyprenyl glycosylphosphotransferase